jgi:nicotinate-nucleotide pyrophosphorylase (carboxylating)
MPTGRFDFNRDTVSKIVRDALEEDIGSGDVTTRVLVPPGLQVIATLTAQSPGVLAGLFVMEIVYEIIGAVTEWEWLKKEGNCFERGDLLCRFAGDAALILTGERVALNFLQRLSGIATTTRQHRDKLQGTGVILLDTRKTTPLLRELEKYAVRAGGGENHRYGLYDRVLIKDNHLAVVKDPAEAVHRARNAQPNLLVEVEVCDAVGFDRALSAKPDWILLDNMHLSLMKECVKKRNESSPSHVKLEASGRVTLETLREIALTGVDAISVGALTHSAPWCDISMEVAF